VTEGTVEARHYSDTLFTWLRSPFSFGSSFDELIEDVELGSSKNTLIKVTGL
jgi:hypothetical protein